MSRSSWITATPPTPNGDLHVGHMAGPYVAADVLRRFLGADGHDTRYTTGLDDHQGYVAVRGLKDGGLKAGEIADYYAESIVRTWDAADIALDHIARPRRDAGYLDYVQAFFQQLYDEGHIVARTRPLPYCGECDRWLYEGYLAGSCPLCGCGTNGNACEPCGRPIECGDVIDPSCVPCGAPAELRENSRLHFPLMPFAEQLAAFWAEVDMPPHLRVLCERMLADGLPEIAVSHPADWGVRVPVAGFEDQRIFVWFEMAPGYLWQHDATNRTLPAEGPIQFFGFDNGYFHAVLFPALFAAYDSTVPLPRTFVVNEFYQFDGRKFSTSQRHAYWAHEALAEVGSTVLRYHVLSDRPHGRQTSFSLDALERSHQHLATTWDGWISRLAVAVERDCDGLVPVEEPTGKAWELLRGRLTRLVMELREAYGAEGFDTRRVIDLLDEVVSLATDFAHVHEHEHDRPNGLPGYRAALKAQLAVAAALSAWAAPALPTGAGRLAALLGVPANRPVDASAVTAPTAGTRISAPNHVIFSG